MNTNDLRALLAKATPGPWALGDGTGEGRNVVTDEPEPWYTALFYGGADEVNCDSNAALVVAAVNALPALLDRLEAAERDAARWIAFCNLWLHYTEMSVTQDEDGRYSITGVEPVEHELLPGQWTGDDPDAAIDAARGTK